MRKLLFLSVLALFNLKTNAQWIASNNGLVPIKGLKNANIRAFAANTTTLFAGTTDGVFMSKDNGELWTKAKLPVQAGSEAGNEIVVTAISVSEKNVYVSTNGGIYASANGGLTWIESKKGLQKNLYLPSTDVTNAVAVKGNVAVAGFSPQAGTDRRLIPNSGGIYVSIDNGKNWKASSTGLEEMDVQNIAVSGNNIFASTYKNTYLSKDNGANWAVTEKMLGCHATSGTSVFASHKEMFFSNDNGLTWTSANTNLPSERAVRAIANNGKIAVAGVDNIGIYYTTTNGKNWIPIKGDIPNLNIQAVTISGDNILIGTNNGIWKRPISGLTGK